jgi:EAL domain-containing protein (putative c-di-GMP-specific phosphodiesterase class I)
MQGYLLSRPLNPAQLRDWLRTQPACLELRGAASTH